MIKKNLTLLLGAALFASSVSGETVFSNYFNNGTGLGGDNLASDHNWNGSIGTAGADVTAIGNVGVSQGVTNASGVPVVSGISTIGGFLFALPADNVSEASILYTTNLTSSNATPSPDPQSEWYQDTATGSLSAVTVGNVGSISFYARNGSTSPVMRVALQVGGVWYASATSFQTTQTTNYEQFSLTPSSINWYQGAFVAGSSLSADVTALTSIALSASAPIQGYGVYADIGGLTASNSRMRIDNFEVTAVPEPATFAMVLGLMGLVVVCGRRMRARRA
jgi:hypothetical protein